MTLINVTVEKITQETEDVRTFSLARFGFFRLPKYRAGAHIDVHCGEGIIRQYSLCGDPHDRRHYQISVKRAVDSRGGSELMHGTVKQGDRIEIGSPRNNFALDESADHVYLLAAGIGITPLIAMADRLQAIGLPFELNYFSRSPEFTVFEKRLENGTYKESVHFHQGLNSDETHKELKRILSQHRPGSQIYICGPGPFMETAETLALCHWPSELVKLERFAANPALSSAPTYPFEVVLAKSGTTLQVGAEETILEVLERENINAAFSCEQGVCGTCVTKILDGIPDHRDSFLSPRQRLGQDKMCLCVSRAKGSKVVLDL